MSTVLPAVEPAGPARTSGLAAIFEHTRYVLGENRVTAFAFGLLVVILFAAIFGPYIVPYDPLASDTAAALKPPSAAHWFGTCLLYTSPSPRDRQKSRMPSSA